MKMIKQPRYDRPKSTVMKKSPMVMGLAAPSVNSKKQSNLISLEILDDDFDESTGVG